MSVSINREDATTNKRAVLQEFSWNQEDLERALPMGNALEVDANLYSILAVFHRPLRKNDVLATTATPDVIIPT